MFVVILILSSFQFLIGILPLSWMLPRGARWTVLWNSYPRLQPALGDRQWQGSVPVVLPARPALPWETCWWFHACLLCRAVSSVLKCVPAVLGLRCEFPGWERSGFVPHVGCGAEFLRCRLRSLVGSPVLSRPGGVAGLSVMASLGPAQPVTGERGADFRGVTWWCFKSNFESSVLCVGIVSSLIPLYITCVYSYFPFLLVIADK